MRQFIAFVECVLCVLCILPVREQRVAPVQPRRKGWMLPADAFRCVLGEADVVQPRAIAPVNASLNRDGYDMDAIPAFKPARKPRKATTVKATAKPTTRKATTVKVAAQTVAHVQPVYVKAERSLEDMPMTDLLAEAKTVGVKGASARWKRETLIAKIRERQAAIAASIEV